MEPVAMWHDRLGPLLAVCAVALVAGCAGVGDSGAGSRGGPGIVLAPGQIEGTLAQAAADQRDRRLDKALSGYLAVLTTDPGNTRARDGAADTCLAMGNAGLALKMYDSAPSDQAERPQALQGRGLALLQAGGDEAARDLLVRAVNADPSLWRSWNGLALLHDRQHEWVQADAGYRSAADANPEAAEVFNNWGYSLLQRGDRDAAIAYFQQALRIDPALEAAGNNLVLAMALQGQYERALAASPAAGLPVALNNVGFAAIVRGDYDSAETYLVRAVQASPRYFERASENLRWLNYLRAGESEAARMMTPLRRAEDRSGNRR
jgi:Flp pilus assembly protein TadD